MEGHLCPARELAPCPHGEGSGLGVVKPAREWDPVWDTCWGWAAAGGPGLSFMFGASEEGEQPGQRAGGWGTLGHCLLHIPALWPFLCALSFPVALPALLLALGLGFLFCVRVDSGCLF